MHFDFFYFFLRTLLLAKQTERETVSRWQLEAQMTNQLPVLPTIPPKSHQQVGKCDIVGTERCLEWEGWIVSVSNSCDICRVCLWLCICANDRWFCGRRAGSHAGLRGPTRRTCSQEAKDWRVAMIFFLFVNRITFNLDEFWMLNHYWEPIWHCEEN